MLNDRRRIDRGDYVKVGDTFYQVGQIERPSIHEITVTLGIAATTRYDLDGRTAGVPSFVPNTDRIFYVFALGINGGVRMQPFFPNPEPRLTASGISVQLDRHQAPYTNPWKVDFAVRNPNFPSLNITEDNGGVAVTADVWLYFELLWVRPRKPIDVPSRTLSDGKKLFLFRELNDWGQNPYTGLAVA